MLQTFEGRKKRFDGMFKNTLNRILQINASQKVK